MKTWQWALAMFMATAIGLTNSAFATQRDAEAELNAAYEEARKVLQEGPVDIAIKDQATLKLPEGFLFVPQPAADQIMKAMGNGIDSDRFGLIYPIEEGDWFVVMRYTDSGYIKDDDARDWKADEMLEQFKAGTEEANKERIELGIAPLEIVGWVQSPTYDAQSHRLVWSLESRDIGAAPTDDSGINYNTYVLGREGFISMNLVTSAQTIAKDKEVAALLLSNTTFNPGKSYADFSASTDRVAEYGIGALVAGAAAKKLGLFAAIAAFIAKFGKVFALALFGAAAGIGAYFKRKKNA